MKTVELFADRVRKLSNEDVATLNRFEQDSRPARLSAFVTAYAVVDHSTYEWGCSLVFADIHDWPRGATLIVGEALLAYLARGSISRSTFRTLTVAWREVS
jgi:hypothetical protein